MRSPSFSTVSSATSLLLTFTHGGADAASAARMLSHPSSPPATAVADGRISGTSEEAVPRASRPCSTTMNDGGQKHQPQQHSVCKRLNAKHWLLSRADRCKAVCRLSGTQQTCSKQGTHAAAAWHSLQAWNSRPEHTVECKQSHYAGIFIL
jgi:hypothetical protein